MIDFLEQGIKKAFHFYGYQLVQTNVPSFYYFQKKENNNVYIICMLDDTIDSNIHPSFLYHGMEQVVSQFFPEQYNVYSLGIYVTNHIDRVRNITDNRWNRWILEASTGKIIIYENEPSQFLNVRTILEQGISGKTPRKKIPLTIVNTILVVLNILYFIVSELCGGSQNSIVMYKLGALQIGSFLENKEWWRLVASGFLHFGFSHLCNNMLVLLGLGIYVEKALGKVKYAVLYMVSLIGANIISVFWYQYNSNFNVLSAGASGAIFGVVGGLLYLVIKNKGRLELVTSKQLIIMMLFTIFHGITSAGVNNAAHIGGAIIGFFLCMILNNKHSF